MFSSHLLNRDVSRSVIEAVAKALAVCSSTIPDIKRELLTLNNKYIASFGKLSVDMFVSNWMAYARSTAVDREALVTQCIANMESEHVHSRHSFKMKLIGLNAIGDHAGAWRSFMEEYSGIQPSLFNHIGSSSGMDEPKHSGMKQTHQCILSMDEEFMIAVCETLTHVISGHREPPGASDESINQGFIHVLTGFLEWQTKYAYRTKAIVSEELYRAVLSLIGAYLASPGVASAPPLHGLNNSIVGNSTTIPSNLADIQKHQATIGVLTNLVLHKVLENTGKRLSYVFPYPSYHVIIDYLRVCSHYSSNSREPSKIKMFENSLNLVQKLNPAGLKSTPTIYQDMNACLQLLEIYKQSKQFKLAIAFVTECLHHSALQGDLMDADELQLQLCNILIHCNQLGHARRFARTVDTTADRWSCVAKLLAV